MLRWILKVALRMLEGGNDSRFCPLGRYDICGDECSVSKSRPDRHTALQQWTWTGFSLCTQWEIGKYYKPMDTAIERQLLVYFVLPNLTEFAACLCVWSCCNSSKSRLMAAHKTDVRDAKQRKQRNFGFEDKLISRFSCFINEFYHHIHFSQPPAKY